MRASRVVRTMHRWIGLLIGIQVLLWVSGGLIMSSLRLEEVRGEHLATRKAAPAVSAAEVRVSPGDVIARSDSPVSGVTLVSLLGEPVYRVQAANGAALFSATSGEKLSPISGDRARAIAQADYTGEAPVGSVEWVDTPATEYRGRGLPLWRVNFDDTVATAVYVSPATGEVVARRNDLWRVFDFVWMLHIMDYDEREDFNHPLLVIAAATAFLFVLTGLTLLVLSFRKPRS